MSRILLFADRVGITPSYAPALQRIMVGAGLLQTTIVRRSYDRFPISKLLHYSKNRKQPGFVQDPTANRLVETWVYEQVALAKPEGVVVMDPALLFMFNNNWNQATLDTLRGGVYWPNKSKIPWLVTLPITAINTHAKAKDIAALNNGYSDKAEWEESIQVDIDYGDDADDDDDDDDDSDQNEDRMHWHEPFVVPYGKYVLGADFAKLGRVLRSFE